MSMSGSRSGLVLELAEEFVERYRRGERPSLKEYVDRHPELAGEIRDVFPAMAMMEKIALADESLTDRAPAGPPPARPPRLGRLGDFRVLREIGRGGMGVVYEAEQVSLGRHVALKVLPESMLRDPRQRQRFEREARAAGRLHHTNIVPVFGVGEHDGMPYYVMQFIHGRGLDEVLDELKRLRDRPTAGAPEGPGGGENAGPPTESRRDASAANVARSLLTGRFDAAPAAPGSDPPPTTLAGTVTIAPTATERDPSPGPRPGPGGGDSPSDPGSSSSSTASLLGSVAEPGVDGRPRPERPPTYWQGVARIGVQVAQALEYAHKQGIVHRDVKPSNLLLDTLGTVWVADFGLAKSSDQQNLTHTGDLLGTLRYMPPEAFEGKADHRGDVYALGLTLYELLALRPAFDEKDRGRLVRRVTTEEPPRLRTLNPDVPRDLETVVHKAIDRDPGHRYPSAGELASDLQRFHDDEPILARRQTQAERYRRWARRHPGIAALGAALTAVLLLATAASLVVAGRMSLLAERQARAARAADQARRHEAEQRAVAVDALRRANASAREAEAQRARAEANFARARRAVDDFFTEVSETRLLTAPGLQPLRLELLRSALAFYEEFLKERGADPALRAELLATRYRVGRILQEIGRGGEAAREFEAARQGYRQVALVTPADPVWKEGLYQVLTESGARTADDRIEQLREAIALCEELARANPGERRYRKDLADLQNLLGNALSRANRREEAVEAYRESVELRLDLAASRPDDLETLESLGQSFNNIAATLKGSPAQALPMYRRAVDFVETARRRKPQDYNLGRSLGILYTNYANTLWELGRTDAALRVLETRADQQRSLARDNPAVPGGWAASIDALSDLAERLNLSGRTAEAVSSFLQVREMLHRLPREGADQLFEAAARHCWFASTLKRLSKRPTAEQERICDEALAGGAGLLRQAVDAGFRDHQRFQREQRIIPLRSRAEFPELAARVAAAEDGPAAAGPSKPAPEARPDTAAVAPPVSILAGRATIRQALGVLLLEQGKIDEAARALDEALALREQTAGASPDDDPDSAEIAELWLALAEIDRRAGRHDRARERLARAEQLQARAADTDPSDSLLWKGLGAVHARLGRTDEAAADLARAMARVPDPGAGAWGLWYWTDRTGIYQAAASDPDLFERVVRLRPDDAKLYRARITYLTERRDWREVADLIARLKRAHPNQWYDHVEAIVRAWTFDTEGYRRVCRETLARNRTAAFPGVPQRVAQTCLLLQGALPDLRELGPVIALMSFDPGEKFCDYSFWAKGLYADRTGDPHAALEAYRQVKPWSFGIVPPNLHAAMAIAYQRTGRPDQARRELDEAKRALDEANFDPDHEGSIVPNWHDWLYGLILLREAEALILYAPIFPADPFAP